MKNIATPLLLLATWLFAWNVQAQSSAFTYQGRLTDGGAPANGSYDVQFKLFDAVSAGAQVGGTVGAAPLAVSNGVFTVALDFGAGAFTGASRFIEIAVRTNGSVAAHTVLTPRQPITAVPYALYALTPAGPQGPQGPAGTTGATGPQGSPGVPGPAGATGAQGPQGPQGSQGIQGVRGLTFRGAWTIVIGYAADDAVFANGSAWLARRANTGVTPVEGEDWTLLVQQGVAGATGPQGTPGIAGPQGPIGLTGAQGLQGPIGLPGTTTADGILSGTLADGRLSGNVAFLNGTNLFIGTNTFAGVVNATNLNNTFSGAFIGNGAGLTGFTASQITSGILGDTLLSPNIPRLNGNNTFSGTLTASSYLGTGGPLVLGTTDNQPLELKVNGLRALRLEPAVDGGGNARPNMIGGATNNSIATYASFIGGGALNAIQTYAEHSTIGGGESNTIKSFAFYSTIGGGDNNSIGATRSFIGGGYFNTIQSSATRSFIGSGYDNMIQTSASYSTVGGGESNTIQTNSNHSFIGGGRENTIQTDARNSVIAGGEYNTIQTSAYRSTIGGGDFNTIQTNAYNSFIGGGNFNMIKTDAHYSTIGGGVGNTIQTVANSSTIGGGVGNDIEHIALDSTISGGAGNTIQVNAIRSTIGGGADNTIQTNGHYATIPGGYSNSATNYAFAAGNRAKANHTGAFVWADSTDADFTSATTNQFLIRASGFVGINKNNPATALDVNGTVTATGFSGSGAGLTGFTPLQIPNLDASKVISGTFTATQIPNLDAAKIISGTLADAILSANIPRLNGNNTFSGAVTASGYLGNGGPLVLGTTNSQPLELKVSGARAFRLEPNTNGAPNVIGGTEVNYAAEGVSGATIGGGGATSFFDGDSFYSFTNSVLADFGTIGGGGAKRNPAQRLLLVHRRRHQQHDPDRRL